MADAWLERGLVHARRSGDARALVLILRQQAAAAVNLHNDYARAEPLARECLQLQQTLHDPLQICYRQGDLAACWLYTGRAEAAAALMENALLECRRQEPSVAQAYVLLQLGRIRLAPSQPQPAELALRETVALSLHHDWPIMLIPALCHLPQAWVCQALTQPERHPGLAARAAQLQGYAAHARQLQFGKINPIESREMKRTRRLMCRVLGAQQAQALRLAGSQLSLQQAMALLEPPSSN